MVFIAFLVQLVVRVHQVQVPSNREIWWLVCCNDTNDKYMWRNFAIWNCTLCSSVLCTGTQNLVCAYKWLVVILLHRCTIQLNIDCQELSICGVCVCVEEVD